MKKSYEMDMCSGSVVKKVLSFSTPLMLSGVLQLLFNAADVIVVGRCNYMLHIVRFILQRPSVDPRNICFHSNPVTSLFIFNR